MDGFRSRHVTLSCPGDSYFVYESWPMSDQTKIICFFFFCKNSSLKFLTVEIVSAVVAYCMYKKWTIYTASNKQQHAIAFEELNDEGSHTTMFRAWNNVSTALHDQTTQTVDLGGSDLDDTIISCIVYFRSWLSVRLSVATKRTRSGYGQSPYWPRVLD